MRSRVLVHGRSMPEPIAPKALKITKQAFWKRVTVAKRALLLQLAKESFELEAQLLTISDSEYIDLEDPELLQGLQNLTTNGVFTEEHLQLITKEAEDFEIPEILKTGGY
ncbi:hypothetical protein [Pseudoalteromonas phage vB_PtuP_Slicky01]|nr:hypothetical protein [Pseudoalteromonas phage vB_PtuP_Slicky01]